MISKAKDYQEAILMYWAVPGHKAAIIQLTQPMSEWLPHGFLLIFVTKAKSKGKEKVKPGPTNLTEIMENKNIAPFMHSVAKPLCFQKDYGCCEKALKSKTTMVFWAMKAQ